MASQGNSKRKRLTPAQWARAEQLFDAALEVAGDRGQWLESACADDPDVRAEVESLLASDSAANAEFGANRIEPAIASLLPETAWRAAPERAGPYRLVRELGQGGMGTVYLAERDDDQYKTQAAVKLVRRGLDTDYILQRFYRERQTLARLQHPHIAHLLDGGTTADGMPYIVMEYIEGTRITDYCRDRGLSIAGRLRLFLNVCDAVDYAHRQFVVHRDLKPGNILVNQSGEVKLLDFGICKLLQSHTPHAEETFEAGPSPLTPDYASPEQIRGGAITVASDIYSLAAVLYELLTGVKPHKIEEYSVQGIERGICGTGVDRPSAATANKAWARQLQGDLDNILLRALQKEPARRYASMEHFAEDIKRHLAHQPVQARPDTFSYRAGKFLRRRRGLVAAMAAVTVTLAAGVASTMRSARIANENLRLVRQLSNTFVFDVYESVESLPGATNARELIVKTGLQYLDNLSRNAGGDPELARELAAAYRRIGDVQGGVMAANLGNIDAALASYSRAQKLLESASRRDPLSTQDLTEQVMLHRQIGWVQSYRQDFDKAMESYGLAKQFAEEHLRRAPSDPRVARMLADVCNSTAESLRRRSDYTAARAEYSRAVELLKPHEDTLSLDLKRTLATGYSGVAACDLRAGRLKEALEEFRRVTQIREAVVRADPHSTPSKRDLMIEYGFIGDVLGNPNRSNLGDMAGAMVAYRKAVEIARQVQQADPADARAKTDYGIALARLAAVTPEPAARVKLFETSIPLLRDVVRADRSNATTVTELGAYYMFLGDAHKAAGDEAKAYQAYREGLPLLDKTRGSGASLALAAYARLCGKLGELASRRGERALALDSARRALELAEPAGDSPRRPPRLQRAIAASAYGSAGLTYAALARSGNRVENRAEARKWLEKSLAQFDQMQREHEQTEYFMRERRGVEKALEGMK